MLNIKSNFLEPVINREASQYIEEHYNEILAQLPKLGVHEDKTVDILNDVFVSIIEAENEGNGYDLNKAKDGDCILVSQFIYGRLKRYSKNSRYRTDVVEKNTKNEVIASSTNCGDDYDTMDSFQRAYSKAGEFDELEEIEDELSIVERIDFCMEFDHVVGMSMLNLFKNIEVLGQQEICKSLFDPLKGALKFHDEFAEAFRSVVEYSMKYKTNFKNILANFK